MRCSLTWRIVVALLSVLGAAACEGTGDGDDGRIVVFAAASLTEAFGELATGFRTTGGGVAVELTGLDLGEQRADVGLVGVDGRGDGGDGERVAGERAAGHLLGAESEKEARVGEVGQAAYSGGVPGRHGDLEPVGGEVDRVVGCSRS